MFQKFPWPEEDDRYVVTWRALVDGDLVIAGDESLTALHTPGHSPDHVAFWHERTRTVFSGDLVTQGSSVMIHTSRGGNLAEYMASLERLLALQPRALLPAHGPREMPVWQESFGPPSGPTAVAAAFAQRRLQVLADYIGTMQQPPGQR
jgi:glyoxylase-like metal-dependent hydrolase (beta-lactamase superfamily II)